MVLSILTATYNREEYLKKIYESIIENEKKSNFRAEWIIIDDGSTDNTKSVVQRFKEENIVNIKYIYQQNSGKMAAINRGMEEVTGELIVDCDSDDHFTKDAFYIIEQNAFSLLKNKELYALCFLKQNLQEDISGKIFQKNYMESTMFDLYFKQDIKGEKILVFNTQIRKKYKHELEKNEKFITEARMYHKMDEKYRILCINEFVEIGDYQEDGYTKNIRNTFWSSPNGYYMYFKEIIKKGLKKINWKKKIYILKYMIFFRLIRYIKNNYLSKCF